MQKPLEKKSTEKPKAEPKTQIVANGHEELTSDHIGDFINKEYMKEMQQTQIKNYPEVLAALVEEEKKYVSL